jgi:hypothetical protein
MCCELQHIVARHRLVEHRLPAGGRPQVSQQAPDIGATQLAGQYEGEKYLGTGGSFTGVHRTGHQRVKSLVEREGNPKTDLPIPADPQ